MFSSGGVRVHRDRKAEIHALHVKVGELMVERDFIEGTQALDKALRAFRKPEILNTDQEGSQFTSAVSTSALGEPE